MIIFSFVQYRWVDEAVETISRLLFFNYKITLSGSESARYDIKVLDGGELIYDLENCVNSSHVVIGGALTKLAELIRIDEQEREIKLKQEKIDKDNEIRLYEEFLEWKKSRGN